MLSGLVGSLDGKQIIRANITGDPLQAEAIGKALGAQLLDQGARDILQSFYNDQSA
jgi:hydroxymethylbilane synthase